MRNEQWSNLKVGDTLEVSVTRYRKDGYKATAKLFAIVTNINDCYTASFMVLNVDLAKNWYQAIDIPMSGSFNIGIKHEYILPSKRRSL